ncbi:hypothetical protein EDD86DRAFT_244079 [Gorgonomyces haynaldii]|nr:hypothetical protein EDD86DRAFT_244079 [Gorgonomyces haynaldii]
MLEKEADYNKQDALAHLLSLLNQLKEWMIKQTDKHLWKQYAQAGTIQNKAAWLTNTRWTGRRTVPKMRLLRI